MKKIINALGRLFQKQPAVTEQASSAADSYNNDVAVYRSWAAASQEPEEPSPLAIFAIAFSMLTEFYKLGDSVMDSVYEAKEGGIGTMQAMLDIANKFEAWACEHVDFEVLDYCYVYLMEEEFGSAYFDTRVEEGFGALGGYNLHMSNPEKIAEKFTTKLPRKTDSHEKLPD